MGCFFRYVGLLEIKNQVEITWVSNEINESWQIQYITCIYWAVVTMVTLGYGDIVPKTPLEKSFTIIIVLISCGMFGYCLSQIGNLIAMIGKDKQEFNERMEEVERFVKDKNLNLQLQLKIRKHFEFKYKQELSKNAMTSKLLDEMHENLRYETCKEIYSSYLNAQSLFRLNFSTEFISEICLSIKEKRLAPEEYLYQIGDQSASLYFLLNGNISIVPGGKFKNRILDIESKGSILGLYEFLKQQTRETSAKANENTLVGYIPYLEFLEAIKNYPKDYEKFCYIRDLVSLSAQTSGFDMKCQFCHKFDHQFASCPSYQYIPNLLREVKNQKNTVQLSRQTFLRLFPMSKVKTLGRIKEYQECAYDFNNIENTPDKLENTSIDLDEDSEDKVMSPIEISAKAEIQQRDRERKRTIKKKSETLINYLKAQKSVVINEELYSPKVITNKLHLFEKKKGSAGSITEIDSALRKKPSSGKNVKVSAKEIDIVLEQNSNMETSINYPQQLTQLQQIQSAILNNENNSGTLKREVNKKLLSVLINNRSLLEQAETRSNDQNLVPFMFENFDSLKEFLTYFPMHNYPQILKEIQKLKKTKGLKSKSTTSAKKCRTSSKSIDQLRNSKQQQ